MKIWEPKPPGTLWATPGLLRDFFTFAYILNLEQVRKYYGGKTRSVRGLKSWFQI